MMTQYCEEICVGRVYFGTQYGHEVHIGIQITIRALKEVVRRNLSRLSVVYCLVIFNGKISFVL